MAFQRVTTLDELATQGSREFMVSGRVVAVFQADGQVYAVDGMCAHQGGPISQGELDGKCVTCPWHGWQYDVSNGNNLLTGKRMLDCFAVEIHDNEVWIDVESADEM